VSRRFRHTDAFVDESIRGQRYLMGCVLIEARHLSEVRRSTAALVPAGKRLHFHQELDTTRRSALELFATMPVRVRAVVCIRSHGSTEFQARAMCLTQIVRELQERSVPRLTIESRQDDVTISGRSCERVDPSRRCSSITDKDNASRSCGSPMRSRGRSVPVGRGWT